MLMPDFKRRFAGCAPDSDFTSADGCKFGAYRTGLIVAMLSVGTLIGALVGVRLAR